MNGRTIGETVPAINKGYMKVFFSHSCNCANVNWMSKSFVLKVLLFALTIPGSPAGSWVDFQREWKRALKLLLEISNEAGNER